MDKKIIIFLSFILWNNVQCARILAVYPFPSISHQVVFREFTRALANNGHEVVVITPDPMKKEELPKNVTEINTNAIYSVLRTNMARIPAKRGIKITADLLSIDTFSTITKIVDETFNVPEVKSLVNNPKEKFDLIISQSMFHFPIVLAKVFKAPLILFSPYYVTPYIFDIMGAPSRHPLIYGNSHRNRFYDLSMTEKIYEVYMEIRLSYHQQKEVQLEEALLKKHFPEIKTNFEELNNLIDLLFINVNPIFEGNRPLPPNVVSLGALHLRPPKQLSEEWKTYLDSSKRGFIYVSLGTNVKASSMDPEFLEVFLSTFEQLPYDVLWKFDGESLPRIPKNVRVEKWFPQREILLHPNVKVFVAQGGLMSTDEAIDSAIPIVGLPMLADQSFNCERIAKLGIGINLDVLTLTTKQLVDGIITVAQDKSYQENMIRLRLQIEDQPQTPLERAVWWTEYVLRHKGAKHLRSPQFNITWTEYLILDAVAFLLTSVILVTILVCFVVKRMKNSFNTKIKTN